MLTSSILKNSYQRFHEKVSEVQKDPQDVLCKTRKIHKKTPVSESLVIKLHAWGLQLFIKKETPVQVFSCEFC